ncbi:hypothetical protein [Lentzea sp. NPDC003310]|uniref:hypothetical protein n=1 Tax=Lentzea sp. NPDC003310 TaxID=3154447 RepID=UPI0033AA8854
MADDLHSLLLARQKTLRTLLDDLTATDPGDPRWPERAVAVDTGLAEVLDTRRDVDAARLVMLHRALGAAAVVAAVAVLVFWFSAGNAVPAGLAVVVGAGLLVSPAVRGSWEPQARTVAGVAALAGALATPAVGGWAVVLVVAGTAWWGWRWAR